MKFSLSRAAPVFIFVVAIIALWLVGRTTGTAPLFHRFGFEPEIQSPNLGGGAGLSPLFIVQAGITFILLIATLFVILSKRYDAGDKRWAYTTIGTIVGFWLKSGV